MKKILVPVGIGFSTLFAAQAIPQEQDSLDYREGYSLVLEQKWSNAQNHFSEFGIEWPESSWADDADFWNCYSMEQATSEQDKHFQCYENFVGQWPESSWVADASSKLAVLGSELAALGYPEYVREFREDFDFDFDIDSDAMSEAIESAMAEAEREMQRFNAEHQRLDDQGIPMPPTEPVPPMPPVSSMDFSEIRESARQMRHQAEQVRQRFNRESRNSADEELLTVLSALRDNERASEILISRLEQSDSPAMRSRIVLLLEVVEGEHITKALVDVVKNDPSDAVRSNAVLVLIDRGSETTRDLLLSLAKDPDFPVMARTEIIEDMANWDPATTVPEISEIIGNSSDLGVISEGVESLSDIGNQAAIDELLNLFETTDRDEVRIFILEEIGETETPQIMAFLNDIAISHIDDQYASIAIEGIADREDNIALAALEHIYVNSSSLQRRYAAIEGIGESESQQAVDILDRVLTSNPDPMIVSATLRALGDTDLETAVPIVFNTYRSAPNADIQKSAIRALRRLNEYPSATDALLEILEQQLAEDLN